MHWGDCSDKEPVHLMQETQETEVQSLGWEDPLVVHALLKPDLKDFEHYLASM